MALREELLRRLEEHREEDLSGQRLAQELGVSRNAVWKAVEALRAQGVEIVSSTNRGYRLAADADPLSAALIQSELDDPLPVYAFSSIDSTNEEAKRRLNDVRQTPFAVVAEEQTAGKGRRGRSFYSPKGTGLYLSLVLSPNAAVTDVVGITSYAAVCVVEAIREVCGKQTAIKWVNDIYLDGRKVCGILTEAVSDMESGHVSHLIVGVGLNLRPTALPEDLREIVGFLDAKPGQKNRLAAAVLRRLTAFPLQTSAFIDRYRRYSMVLGKAIRYERNGTVYCAKAVDIDETGALLVEREDGAADRLTSGEITLRLA
jgi:BirA family biotin operon repressor/biotin-[acetyl-CoA-carboxylase] ligase